ncbi:MAG: TIGR00725 family protein [Solirubrobacteraceae bacterium]
MSRRAGSPRSEVAPGVSQPLQKASRYIGVVGPGGLGPGGDPSEELLGCAEQVGRLIAAAGATLVCGGLGGVMEAACRGAGEGGGPCIGILPGSDRSEGNRHLTVALATGLGELRNALVVRSCDVLIAVGGSWGTLSEVALALRMNRPVVSLGSWVVDGQEHPALHSAGSAGEAVERALALSAERARTELS